MKYFFLLTAATLVSVNTYSQTFKKDARPDSIKQDYFDEYQAGQISKLDILRALDGVGVRIFNCQLLPRFVKTYHITVDVDEYLNGRLISTKNISPNDKNTYAYWENEKPYADYLSNIQFSTLDSDTACMLKINMMGNSSGMRLKKQQSRKNQWYSWRRFGKTNWTLNEKKPLLVYSSSWYDKKFDIERSCGAVDLSNDKEATKELLESSSHYFMVSYKVSN